MASFGMIKTSFKNDKRRAGMLNGNQDNKRQI